MPLWYKRFIIAEAGVNHNGDIEIAKKLVDVAVLAGADAVKFQTFRTENLVCKDAQKAEYQMETTGKAESQFDMLKRLEFIPQYGYRILNLIKGTHPRRKNNLFPCLSSIFQIRIIRYLTGFFTRDRNMIGPDHKASLEPDELKEMVRAIRNIELSLGNGLQYISFSYLNQLVFLKIPDCLSP